MRAGTADAAGEPIEDGMVALDPAECAHRLERAGVGILALASNDAPVLRPVNYAFHRGQLWIRTGAGRILAAARDGEHTGAA